MEIFYITSIVIITLIIILFILFISLLGRSAKDFDILGCTILMIILSFVLGCIITSQSFTVVPANSFNKNSNDLHTIYIKSTFKEIKNAREFSNYIDSISSIKNNNRITL